MTPLRIGGGSAFFNDRLDAALELVEHGRIEGRARLAADIVARRVARSGLRDVPIRYDLIGVNALALPGRAPAPTLPEARLRVAARCSDVALAELLVTEVEALYVNGPAGGGGVRFSIRPAVRTLTTFLPAADVAARVEYLEVR